MRRKVTGKLISVLVAVTLLYSLLPAGVLAAPGSVGQIYTVLGDSIPTGYGLLFDSDGTAIRPSGELVPGSYPQLFGSAIGAIGRAFSATLAGILYWETAPWASLVYNGTYLIPDTFFCILLALFVGKRIMKMMRR